MSSIALISPWICLLALGAALIMWPIFAGLLYTVPSHVHWLRDTREPAVNRAAAPVRELPEG